MQTNKIISYIFGLGLAIGLMLLAPISNAANPKLLFIQTAKSGTITMVNKQAKKYQLTLHEVHPYVMYFSDRPNRITGIMPLKQFIHDWNKGNQSFAKDHPNAGLEAVTMDVMHGKKILNYVFELANPNYDAKTNTLTYNATMLNGSNNLPKSHKFGYTTLFIDDYQGMIDACLTCGGGF